MPSASSRGRPPKSIDAVLDVAKELFLERGYDGVPLDEVARRVGWARQTLYNRFGSKEALFRAVVDRHWGFFGDSAAARLDVPANEPSRLLAVCAQAILDFLATSDQISFTRLVIAESRHQPWIGEEFYLRGKRPALELFTGKIRELVAAGKLDCPDPDLAARQFLGLIQEFVIWPHVMRIGEATADLPPTETVVDEAIKMFLCRYSPPRTRGRRAR
jgi:TetR/AcrR family transcriptional regulator, regulator of autoinduction and epiphytic fitness